MSLRTLAPSPVLHSSASIIKVLVADDSAFMRTAITRMIESDPHLKVVGMATNGVEALEKAAELKPDVITLDIEMPKLDGLSVLRRLMEENPLPVIMISSLSREGAEATLEAFDLGAFECIPKQLSYASMDILKIREQLVDKVKAAAAWVVPRPKKIPTPRVEPPRLAAHAGPAPAIIAIGTSTGGPKALQQILPELPADLPVGVLVVQHMPPGFTGPFAKRLDGLCKVHVREATDEEFIEPGTVLIAPAGKQMTAYRRTHSKHAVRVSDQPNNTLHMPSVDVMMLSVAELYGEQSMGVILTGMGSDGAKGMKLISEKGGTTVGQDEATCAVYGMPRSCAEMGVLKRVVPLQQVPSEIIHAVRNGAKR